MFLQCINYNQIRSMAFIGSLLCFQVLVSAQKDSPVPAKKPGQSTNKTVFAKLDTNKDGRISLKEYQETAQKNELLNRNFQFSQYDENKDEGLNQDEFKYTPRANPNTKLRFEWKDKNKDGQLTLGEALRGELQRQLAFMRHLHTRFDTNKDSLLSFSEWQNSPMHFLRIRDALLSTRDLDGDDQISLKDCVGKRTGKDAALITTSFKTFDVNNDQLLQRQEFPILADLYSGTSLLFREDYQIVFSQLDKDKNGAINLKEFKSRPLTTYQQKQEWAINRKKVFLEHADQTFKRLDSNEDKQLSLQEFSLSTDLIFSRVDVDQNGLLTISELALVLSGLASKDLEYEFLLQDQDKDHALSKKEFRTISYFYPDRSELFSLLNRDNNSLLNLSEFQNQKLSSHAANLKRSFHRYDANNDYQLSKDEFIKQGRDLELDSLTSFNEKDTNGDLKLSLDEFIAGKKKPSIESATNNFKLADKDKDQHLSATEFKLTPTGRPDALSKLEYLDTNNNGALSLAELTANSKYRALRFRGAVFDRFDDDKSGQLELEEFKQSPVAYSIGLLGIPDKNGDRKLSLHDFTRNKAGKRLELAKFYFSKFDVDKDGWLHQDEFPIAVDKNQPKYALLFDPDLAFTRLDIDGDEFLNLEEFQTRQVPNDSWAKERFEKWLTKSNDLFAKRDTNQDKKLSLTEFTPETPMANWIIADGEVLHSVPGVMFNEWWYFALDRNKDQQVSLEEYLKSKRKEIHEKAKAEFQQVDYDKNDSLTFEEFKYLPNALYVPWDDFWWRDKNKDHFLDVSEFCNHHHYRPFPILGERVLETFDKNKDQKLSYSEFLLMPDANPIGIPLSRVKDNNNDGRVELREFAGMLGGGAKRLAEEHFTIFDIDKNGELNWEEFPYRLNNTSFPTPAIFAYFDKNNDKLLTFGELYPGKKQTGPKGTYALTNQKRFQTLDRNRDSFVDWNEYKTSDPGTRMKRGNQQKRSVAVTFTGGTPAAWLRPEDRPLPPNAITVFKNKDKSHDSRLSFAEYLGKHYSPRSEAVAKIIFAHFNRDSDEYLTFDEFKASPQANPDAETLFKSRDQNQDKKVDLEEFFAYRTDEGPQKRLKEIFTRFDANADESLSLDEFKATPDAKPTSDIVLPTRDMDGDGKLDISEFSDVPTNKPSQTLQTQFEWLDLNHDGFLTLAELKLNDPIIPTPAPATASINTQSTWLSSKYMLIAVGVCLAVGLLILCYKAGKWSAARRA